ncbi:hypothetical protein LPN04_31245 [Rugamonas sp. A1-17]|nr:hypothetical protein [Rugamonas sp. A1-17]
MNVMTVTQESIANIGQLQLLDQTEFDAQFESREKELTLLESEKTLALEPAPSIKGIMKVHGAGSDNLWKVPLAALTIIPGHNPRVNNARNRARIRAIANSMVSEGWYANSVLMGYTAKDRNTGEESIVITAGHTRYLAVQLANAELTEKPGGVLITEVPVVIRTKGVSMDDIQVELIRGNVDGSLAPYEKAIVCQRMYRAGHSLALIEQRTGVRDPWLSKLLKLMSAPEKLKQLVAYEVITATFAIDMIEECGLEGALVKIQEALSRKYPGLVINPAGDDSAGDGVQGQQYPLLDVSSDQSNPIPQPENAAPEAAPQSQAKPFQPKITLKDVNRTSAFDKEVRKFAPSMATALQNVKNDPAFASLSPSVRSDLDKLGEELASLKKKLEGAGAKQIPAGDGSTASQEQITIDAQ